MSKLYNKYKKLKEVEDITYIFKIGVFYIFIAEDAIKMSEELDLKCTYFNNDIYKCGFPISALDKYIDILKRKKIKYKIIDKEVVNEEENYIKDVRLKNILDKIKKEDINKINGLKALEILYELRDILE